MPTYQIFKFYLKSKIEFIQTFINVTQMIKSVDFSLNQQLQVTYS